MNKQFFKEVINKLKYYVYIYSDPETEEIFYVGKGIGNRVFSHLTDTDDTEKSRYIKRILERGQEPKIEILTERVNIEEPGILIRLNRLFHFDMTDIELYDATRGVWKIGKDREKVEYTFAIYDGIVQEVYKVLAWYPAVISDRRPGDPDQLVATSEKIATLLGWKTQYSLEDIIKTYWQWHSNYPNGYN